MGQRKGLGISNPEPLYVLKVDAASNTVIVGPRELAYKKEIIVININWLEAKERPFEASVKIRSTAPGIPALVKIDKPEGNKATVEFKEPAFAPAPGQSAVFYEGDTVTGGGEIATSGGPLTRGSYWVSRIVNGVHDPLATGSL